MSDYPDTQTDVDGYEDDDLDDQWLSTPAASSRASSALSSAHSTPSRSHVALDDLAPHTLPDAPLSLGAGSGLQAQTAFDSYFLHASKPARTSAHVFSQLVPPLAAEEYAAALAHTHAPRAHALWEGRAAGALFAQYAAELAEGFNLLFYGYGSKRRVLNDFARQLARGGGGRRGGYVVVANGFQPGFALKDLLAAVEQIPAVQAAEAEGAAEAAGVEAQTQRIYDLFSTYVGDAPHLYLVIHNIDGPGLRGAKARACLARLALAPRIHLVASIDHIAAPARWTLTELFARKPSPSASSTDTARDPNGKGKGPGKSKGRAPARMPATDWDARHIHAVPRRGFAWLWHDLTTLAPYDFELAGADPSSLSSAGAGTRRGPPTGAAGAGAALVAESAARHVLASVTQKARKLFVLLGGKQLELMADPAGSAEAEAEAAYDYARLFNAARDEFVATSDAALRALLAEFRDHGLVVSVNMPAAGAGGQGSEALWIPMRREALAKVIADVKAEDGQ